ncbi:NAD(P)/FAD-dependent oxidoreductase [Quadrisphaera sp. DSM 44207]|uniref:FAD-dependent oxidoreductase n=1 Tax=Quadrisphaera sp. DSM 44207 TaxID=1881057 RepID=UPI0008881E39|nr:FAD-dependent monooxygenase [Quadrisphaera sp. DSM 44207]SDQ42081.1 2-polyprenyl-6-methoxyphenol hydroxylase [Quadrisphaera sp. DSM 44207]
MTRALVIGGGVAGPVTAVALQKAGIDATVHEARTAPASDVGAWLGLQTNGLDALRALDAEDAVAGVGFPTPVIELRSWTGRVLGALPTSGPRPDSPPGLSMKRSELYQALHAEALRRGVRVRHGSRLVDAHETPDGVTAVFADGTSETADVLVGADGVRSRVRSLVDPDCPPPRHVPVLNTAGYSEHTPAGAQVGRLTMVFGRRSFFGYLAAPTGQTWWFANPPAPSEPTAEQVAATSDAQWRSLLHELHAGDRCPALALVDATPGPLRGWTTHDVPTVGRWHRGRTVLVGDAAHATSPAAGQGSSLAVEDAVVLARCLRDLPVPEALAAFEAARRPRAERVVAHGWRTSSAKSLNPVARTVRDLVMPVGLRVAAARGRDPQLWMRDHHLDWDAPVAAA